MITLAAKISVVLFLQEHPFGVKPAQGRDLLSRQELSTDPVFLQEHLCCSLNHSYAVKCKTREVFLQEHCGKLVLICC
jgi:hypothetical protein